MKLFIQKSVLFVFPVLLLLAGAEAFLRKIPNDYSYKNQYLYNNSKNIEILVLGSSHSLFGINPKYFSKPAFNSAHVSQSLNYDYFIFDKYIEDLSRLKVVILPISYFTLFGQLENGIESWRIKNYSIYYNCDYHNHSLLNNYEIFREKPLSALKRLRKYLKGENNVTVSELGFGLNHINTKQSDLIATGKAAAKRHTAEDFSLLDINMNLLKKIIEKSRSRGIKVVLLTPPARQSYISHLEERQLSMMKESIAFVLKKYPDVEYFDFISDERFFDDDFRDADHLNVIGAKKLTKIIDQSLFYNKTIAYIQDSE